MLLAYCTQSQHNGCTERDGQSAIFWLSSKLVCGKELRRLDVCTVTSNDPVLKGVVFIEQDFQVRIDIG